MRPMLDGQGHVVTDFGFIPWDEAGQRPVDPDGEGGRLYRRALADDGMTAPDPAPAPPAVDLRAYASSKRWEVEIRGITVQGLSVPTDDRAKLLILGAAQTLGDSDEAPFVNAGVNYG